LDHGNLLGRLLLPRDMRDVILQQTVPIVIALDASTARIHWEMVASEAAGNAVDFNPERFLGTFYGLTRQLRTTFAQLPEPPILTERPLRVLIVADPAEDAPLPGAQEEGEAVAAIFDEFGPQSGRKVEVVRLFGPGQATRVSVLDHLINQRFDMMHYAGHCLFNKENPPLSGWIFTGQKVLSANELTRVDRIPRFIFSNACESGITPDRADKRSALMAPSFAEAFFARGVANFVCTAWPIDDSAALEFARRFYRGILGLRGEGVPPESLHEAMREARREIARIGPGGMQTWGAYQHYGDPNLRIIPRGTQTKTAAPRTRKSTRTARRKRRQPRKK
jgi:CHAT domain-containing protein